MTIEVKDISKAFNGVKVLDNFSLDIESEHSYIITGAEGSGKTTFIRILLGLEESDTGYIKLLGDYKYPYICYGTVFQDDRLCEDFTAVDNVAMVSKKVFRETAFEELSRFIAPENIGKKVKELSKRDRRFVSIVRATMIPNDLLVMDEPLAGLSEEDRKIAIDYIRDKQGSGPLVMTATDTTGLNFGRVIDLSAE